MNTNLPQTKVVVHTQFDQFPKMRVKKCVKNIPRIWKSLQVCSWHGGVKRGASGKCQQVGVDRGSGSSWCRGEGWWVSSQLEVLADSLIFYEDRNREQVTSIVVKGSLAQKLPIYERHLSKVKSSRVVSSRVVSSRVESSRVESSRIVSSRVESSRVESSRVESSRVESSRIVSSRVESSRVESSRVSQVE